MKRLYELLRDAVKDFSADSAPRLGASVAFYTIFSISPLFMIAIAIASFFFGAEAARGQIYDQISGLVGPKGAEAIQAIISQPENQRNGLMATAIAIVTLLVGSTGVFMELQEALNRIWEVEVKKNVGIWGFVKHRLLSFAMVLSIGFLLLVSLLLTTAISGFAKWAGGWMPAFEALSQILNFVVSFGIITVLFALIFKYMPDVRMPWRDVWMGAAITSLLFAVGKLGLGMYLAKSSTANAFGAAGSLVVVLIWVYYSAQILFFGAEVTQVYAKRRGSRVVPTKHAVVKDESDQRKEPATGDRGKSRPNLMPRHRPHRAMVATGAQKHRLVVPGLVLLVALFLPKGKKAGG